MLKNQPKWKKTHDPLNLGSGSSKSSNSDAKEAGDENVDGSERPKGRTVAKTRLKEKANKTIVDLLTI